ncbi:quinon protein alcohol dehydrogenase-like superfamily, partial [Mucidula mucida]
DSVVCYVRFFADDRYVATGCNRTAQIYDIKTGLKTWYDICLLCVSWCSELLYHPDGKFLAIGAEDKQIRIWNIAKKRLHNVRWPLAGGYSLDFSPDSNLIVSGSGNNTAHIWNMTTGMSQVLTIDVPLNNDAGVTSVVFSPNGRFVAAGSLDTVVRIWDVQTGQLIEHLMKHWDSVYSVSFTPDGKGLVSGSLDKTLKYWDVSGL